MKKFFKLITTIVTIGGIVYIARDQIKDIYNKIMESMGRKSDSVDDEDTLDDDFVFPEKESKDRGYVSIHITDDETDSSEPTEESTNDKNAEED